MIELISDFLLHNLVVLLAIVLVPAKWVILRICGDSEAQAVALLSVPEDICYVLLGLILGDLSNSDGAFRRYFRGSAHVTLNIIVTAGINVCLAIVIHMLSKWANDSFRLWRAARETRDEHERAVGPNQLELPETTTREGVATIENRGFATFTLLYFLQFAVAVPWLYWIARIVSNP
jgi:hypothetical protein